MNKPAITALITIQQSSSYYLPDAHFKHFGGKPLFQLMVEKLLAVADINRIVITTDSDVVRNMYGGNSKVSIIDFPSPDTLSEDPSTRILEEMLTSDRFTANSLEKAGGEHFLQTQCINPLLSVQTIEDAIERYYTYVINGEIEKGFEAYRFDSVVSLYRIEKRLFDNSNYPKNTLRDNPHFVIFEDTVFNIFSRTEFVKNKNKKFGNNPMFYDVPELESIAVETPTSYTLAKLAYDNKALFA